MGNTLLPYRPMSYFLNLISSVEMSRVSGYSTDDLSGLADALRVKRRECVESHREFILDDVIGEYFNRISLILDKKRINSLVEKIYSVYARDLKPYPEVLATMKKLKKMGLHLGLVSNTCFRPKHHLRDLARFNLIAFLDFLVYSSAIGWRKPHEKIYEKALKKARHFIPNLLPGEVIFVGDLKDKDYDAPRAKGMIGILLSRNGKKKEEIEQIGNLSEIIDVVQKHNS
jgi:FMN phosphatase YigB (HAD superfamily)